MPRDSGRYRVRQSIEALRRKLRERLPALRTGLLSRLVLAFGLVALFVVIANRAAMNGGIILRSEHTARVLQAISPPAVLALTCGEPDNGAGAGSVSGASMRIAEFPERAGQVRERGGTAR